MIKLLPFKAATKLVIWFVLAIMLLARPASATHIVGGELDLQHVAGSRYQLTLNLYFDDVNGEPGALDPSLLAGVFAQGSNQRMLSVSLPLVSNTFVAYTNPACEAPTLRTRKLVYRSTIELPSNVYTNPAGYYAAVERCCRNRTISNIERPEDAGQTFYLEFPAVVRNGKPLLNSTPQIFPPLSDYACRGELFYYDFGGTDADGDSLVYEMATPLNGSSSPTNVAPDPSPAPYAPVNWLPGLSVTNQIPGVPALGIDRRTGRLTVRPSQLGLFVFAIKCSEYRKGVKLGEVRRDFQLKVLNCPPNQTPNLSVRLPGQTRPYVPGRDTLRLQPGADRCLRLRFTDPDANSQLTLSLNPINFSGPLPNFSVQQGVVRAPGQPDTLTSQLCFPECLDTDGKVYHLNVIVADNGCSLPRRDTVEVAFMAIPDPNSAPTLRTTATSPLRVKPGTLVTFDVIGTDPDQDPIILEMLGRGFAVAGVGAQFAPSQTGNEVRGRFSWRVPCPTTSKQLYEFEFKAAAAPCNRLQTTSLVIPIEIDYQNAPPALTTTADPARPLVVRPGQVVVFDLDATDADNDPVTLSMQGRNFSAPTLGASLDQTSSTQGRRGTFRWVVPCPPADKLLYEFEFTAASASCGKQQTTALVIPIRIDLQNDAPTLTATANTAQPLRVKPGQLLTFDLLAQDPNNDPMGLTMTGRGFGATGVGAQLTQNTVGPQLRGRFVWRVPCPTAAKSLYEFEFTATDVPCGTAASASLVVPILIEDPNTPPTLTSALFAAAPAARVVQQTPGTTFEATITGFDAETDPLTLTARGVGFDLAAAGMRFSARNEAGRATGAFRWDASCAAAIQSSYEVVFELQETTCSPQPQRQTVRFEVISPEQVAFNPPNIFTPNHDTKNDVFELPTLPPDYCSQRFLDIKIYNRWGKQVYSSTNREFRWDGGGQPTGVYFYFITYSNQRQFKGNVTIAY
ncbi:gliding motility-associated C-terminal domain-containing protein [Hymenobacter sediminis]|uniref:gliding motility-associated C-terminal domain-containing protein n=1 Tax=Hymenobacter sediminis TaxID=2218621 RepID=UPI000DA69405|nr:gliding motility-associated C-terminal domain-containing protein [Hymenobacter sediminis]RPD49476.1 gliding motility-associated C-terminal domain-containing protein [Hymenobacter sediminis]